MMTTSKEISSSNPNIDLFVESIASLVVVAFPKSNSKNFSFALSLAMSAGKYGNARFDDKDMHVACFSKTQADAGRASALLAYVGGWKGVLVFSGGKIVQHTHQISQVISCYLESCACRDSRAHCLAIIDDPASEIGRNVDLSLTIRITDKPSPKQQVEIGRYAFPCSYLLPWFKFEMEHPASIEDQIQAAAVKRGCDFCPHFDTANYRRVGSRTVTKDFFD